MDQEIKYKLFCQNYKTVRTRLKKRKGSVIKNKFFRQIRNEHNNCLSRLGWFENNEND